jgi:spermidine synthase
MSAYTEVGDEMVFYEIDPEVVALATNPALFTYVTEAKGNTDIVVGDARLQLAKAPDRHFDLIHRPGQDRR